MATTGPQPSDRVVCRTLGAKVSTVGISIIVVKGSRFPSVCSISAKICTAVSESPPSSKKLSVMPIGWSLSAFCQMATSDQMLFVKT
jgi:hypothetical protein